MAQIDVYNLALSHVGVGTEVQSLTENTTEANVCRRFYEQTVNEMLRDFPWPFARRTALLAKVADDPTYEWAFAYRYPADCLKIRRILGVLRNENRADRVPYVIASDTTGLLIYSDWADATNGTYVEYTAALTDLALFPPDFVRAMSYLLASYIGARVTSGDPFKLADRAFKLYLTMRDVAQANSLNEEQVEVLPESSFIEARS